MPQEPSADTTPSGVRSPASQASWSAVFSSSACP
jgi:hypothetical protein